MWNSFRVKHLIFLLFGIGSGLPSPAQSYSQFWSTLIEVSGEAYLVDSRVYDLEASRSALTALEKSRLPVVSFSADLPGITRQIEPILQDDGTQAFIPRSLTYSSGFISVRQLVPSTGTEVSLISGAFRTGTFLGDMSLWQTQPAILRISQPLFRRSPFLRQAEELTNAVSLAEKQQIATRQEMLLQLFQDWWQIRLEAVNLQEAIEKSEQLDSMLSISESLWEAGHRSYQDLIQIRKEAGYSRINLTVAKARQLSVRQKFQMTWGVDWEACGSWNHGGLPVPVVNAARRISSIDAELLRIGIKTQEEEIRQINQERLPQISIDGLIGLNQTGTTFTEAVRDPLLSQYFSISLNHTLLDWGQTEARKAAEEHKLSALLAEEAHLIRQETAEIVSKEVMLNELRAVFEFREGMILLAKEELSWMKKQYNAGNAEIRSLFEANNHYNELRIQQGALEAECWQLWLELFLLQPAALEQLSTWD